VRNEGNGNTSSRGESGLEEGLRQAGLELSERTIIEYYPVVRVQQDGSATDTVEDDNDIIFTEETA
jgi:hypothetical protein